ncbi:hypothetical protein SAMN05216200_107148 [Oceanicella actignis]|uniref:Uncharacterized protein n=1 Tax=Oceanicella actignis TaxID=1189325 RepID=A0A1M7TKX9_9RHOB|nr:hypothetical protein SAMN05216200_107148 [Oceanicella actignis]
MTFSTVSRMGALFAADIVFMALLAAAIHLML